MQRDERVHQNMLITFQGQQDLRAARLALHVHITLKLTKCITNFPDYLSRPNSDAVYHRNSSQKEISSLFHVIYVY